MNEAALLVACGAMGSVIPTVALVGSAHVRTWTARILAIGTAFAAGLELGVALGRMLPSALRIATTPAENTLQLCLVGLVAPLVLEKLASLAAVMVPPALSGRSGLGSVVGAASYGALGRPGVPPQQQPQQPSRRRRLPSLAATHLKLRIDYAREASSGTDLDLVSRGSSEDEDDDGDTGVLGAAWLVHSICVASISVLAGLTLGLLGPYPPLLFTLALRKLFDATALGLARPSTSSVARGTRVVVLMLADPVALMIGRDWTESADAPVLGALAPLIATCVGAMLFESLALSPVLFGDEFLAPRRRLELLLFLILGIFAASVVD